MPRKFELQHGGLKTKQSGSNVWAEIEAEQKALLDTMKPTDTIRIVDKPKQEPFTKQLSAFDWHPFEKEFGNDVSKGFDL